MTGHRKRGRPSGPRLLPLDRGNSATYLRLLSSAESEKVIQIEPETQGKIFHSFTTIIVGKENGMFIKNAFAQLSIILTRSNTHSCQNIAIEVCMNEVYLLLNLNFRLDLFSGPSRRKKQTRFSLHRLKVSNKSKVRVT